MSEADTWQQLRDSSTPEHKLAILRSEMITPIATVQGFAQIIKKHAHSIERQAQADDFYEWADAISIAGDKLKLILDYLTSPNGKE